MASVEEITLPEDATEALTLAAHAVAKAAGLTLWDNTSAPVDWYERYGQVQQIIHALADLARNSIDNIPLGIGDRELYADELGAQKDPIVIVGEWNVRTNAAIFSLGQAAGNWGAAHSCLGRLGVRDTVESEPT